jgi:hypothetical protein
MLHVEVAFGGGIGKALGASDEAGLKYVKDLVLVRDNMRSHWIALHG